jgi:phosphohistidine phosphatase
MDLLVIRHGKAEPRGPDGSDESRRLTDEGRKQLRRSVSGLRKLVPSLDALVSSPLVRAIETAEIVAETYEQRGFEQTPVLEPERDPRELAGWLVERQEKLLAIVGHEPLLSHAATWFLSGLRTSFIELGKAGVLLLHFPDEIAAGRARLVFALTAKQLRELR